MWSHPVSNQRSRGEIGQIVNFLKKYNGESIQHFAVGARDIYTAVDTIAEHGVSFMPGPPDSYCDMSKERESGHEEPLELMKKHGILIEGVGVVNGGETKILLQIFSKTLIGPFFLNLSNAKATTALVKETSKLCLKALKRKN